MAKLWPMLAGRARRPRRWNMRIPPSGRTGPCFPRKVRWPISLAIMSKCKPIMRRPSKSRRRSRMFCPISGFPTRFKKIARGRNHSAQSRGRARCRSARAPESRPRPCPRGQIRERRGSGAARSRPQKDASANVAAIRQMIAQSNTWKQIEALDAKPGATAKTHTGSNLD